MSKLARVSIAGQPELEAALNRIIDNVNAMGTDSIEPGRGIDIIRVASKTVIEARPENVFQVRGFYPRILSVDNASEVGVMPGYVTFLRDLTTSSSVVPYIGSTPGTGTLINAADPPSIDLTDDGDYYTRLELEDGLTVKLDFVPVDDAPATDANYIIANKFTLTTVSGGDKVISDVEIYQQEPLVSPATSGKWFRVRDTSDPTAETPTHTVKVAAGRITAPDLAYVTSDPPSAATLLESYTIAESSDLTVTNGTLIVLKITRSTSKSYNKTISGGGVSLTLNNVIWTYDTTTPAVAEAHSSMPSNSNTTSYVLLATVSITDGEMTIKQHTDGVINVPPFTLPYPSAISNSNSGEDYWTTEYVSSGTVNIVRGALVSFNYYLVSDNSSTIQQTIQTDWEPTAGGTASADIVISSITDGDYLWVEIPLIEAPTDFSTSPGTYETAHTHQVYTSYREVQGGVNIPFINHGDATAMAMSDNTIKYPFARLVGSSVVQLHRGLMVVPPFFTVVTPPP